MFSYYVAVSKFIYVVHTWKSWVSSKIRDMLTWVVVQAQTYIVVQ